MKMGTIEVVARILFIVQGLVGICTAQPGFTSIDCGKEGLDYVDGLEISWRNDSTYIAVGQNGAISINESQWQFPLPLRSTLRDFRYFPQFQPKECYEIPVLEDATYIVRATFLHGGHPALQLPISFDISINATMWTSLQFDSASSLGFTKPVTKESVIYSPGTVVFICLLPRTGSPFISSLELRRIDDLNTTSPFLNHEALKGKYMRDGVRYNCGADPGTPDLRFPDDSVDRIWETPDLNMSSKYPNMKAPRGNAIVPSAMMRDAWGADDENLSMSIGYDVERGDGVYVLVSTQELSTNASPSNVRAMRVSLNVEGVTPFAVNSTSTALLNPNLVGLVNVSANLSRLELVTAIPTDWTGRVNIFWEREQGSNLGPIVNAVEMYTVAQWHASRTQQEDLSVLEDLQAGLNLTRWHFDPCFPVAETWIECNVTSGTPVKINVTGNRVPFEFSAIFNEKLWSLNSLETVIMDRTNISVLDLSLWHDSLRRIEAGAPGSSIQLFSLVNSSITTIVPAFNVLADQIARMLGSPTANALNGGILLGGSPFCEDARRSLGESYSQKNIELAFRYLCRFSSEEMPASDKLCCATDNENSRMQKHVIVALSTTTGALTLLSFCLGLGLIWKMLKQKETLDDIDRALAELEVKPRFYSYHDIKAATQNFHPSMKLGNGISGAVYKGELEDGTVVAVKKLLHCKLVLHEFLKDVVLITGFQHRNLVQLKGCCIKDEQRILVYEYAEKNNLAEALWDSERRTSIFLNWQQRFNICVGIARGLSYLHEELQPAIVHGDVKPANILLDRDYHPKIADFGLVGPFSDGQTLPQSTGYFAPEYASEKHLTEKADVFSYGVLVLETVSGRKCIDHNMAPEQVFLVKWGQALYEDGTSSLLELLDPELRAHWEVDEYDVTRLIKIGLSCLQPDPTRRPPMSLVVTMLLGNLDVTDLCNSRTCENQMTFGSSRRDSQLPLSSTLKDLREEHDRNQAQRALLLSISRHDSSIVYHFHSRRQSYAAAAPGGSGYFEAHEDAEYETPLNPSSIRAEVELSLNR